MIKQLYLYFFICFFPFLSFSQDVRLPVVKASSEKAYFLEGERSLKNYWWLDPSLALDVYETNKTVGARIIEFHTDIDSLKFKVTEGINFDFIVIINETDTCYTRVKTPTNSVQYQHGTPVKHDTIPFVLTNNNNIKIDAVINGKDSIELFFDTGNTDLNIKQTFIYDQTSLLDEKTTSYTLEDGIPLENEVNLRIGSTSFNGLTVYPTSFAAHSTAGGVGWNIFDGRIVEIDYEKSVFIIHSSLPKEKHKGYFSLDITYDNSVFFVEGDFVLNGHIYSDRFLFDLSYQKMVFLDQSLLYKFGEKSNLKITETTQFISQEGNLYTTSDIQLDKLILGKSHSFFNIPAQIFDGENPMGFKTHIIGNELLKRFNSIIDFQNNRLYLKANRFNKLDFVRIDSGERKR